MKYIRTDGTVVDGTPEELAAYHKLMTRGLVGRPPSAPAVRRQAAYGEAENAQIRKMLREGRSYKQIARKLWALKLSPYRRTPGSVQMNVFRNLSK